MQTDSKKVNRAQTPGLAAMASLFLATTATLAQTPTEGGQASSKPSKIARPKTAAGETRTTAQEAPFSDNSPPADAHSSTAKTVDATADGDNKAQSAATIANNNAVDHYELAQYYIGKWDFKMAELELEVALMHVPTMKTAHRDYCVVSLLRGHPLRATAEFMMVVGLGEPIPLNDQEREELTARGAKLHYRKGLEFGRNHEWDGAIAEFKRAQQYAPQNAAIIRSLAFGYASKGDFDQAETEYAKSFAMDPSDPYGHADFAFILSERGQNERAADQLMRAIKLDPKAAALHVDMGWLAEAKGDLATAETEFHEAVQLSPKHAGLWSHLGRVEERLGKASAAKNAYAEALAIDPSQDEARKYLDELKGASGKGQPSSAKQAKKSS